MVLPIYRAVAESSTLLFTVALLQIVCVIVMNQKTSYLMGTFGGNEPPDMWFGIRSKRLYDYLAGIGAEGRAAYLDMVQWDVVPTMPTYSTLLGSLLYRECKKAGITPKLSLIILLATIGDVIETLGCGYATKSFLSKPLTAKQMMIVSNGNRVKWVSLIAGGTMLAVLLLMNLVLSSQPTKPVAQKEETKSKQSGVSEESSKVDEPKKEK